MELTRPLGLAGIGLGLLAGLVEYLTNEQVWVATTAIIGALVLILALCSWWWKWKVVSEAAEPDWTAYQAYSYFPKTTFGWEHENQLDWLKSMRQMASSGKITVFGRSPRDPVSDDENPLQPIKPDYWLDYAFEETTMVLPPEETGGAIARQVRGAGGTLYEDLRFNKRQVKRAWKRRPLYKRIHIQNPLKSIFYMDP